MELVILPSLDDACRAVDAAHLCGELFALGTLEETHFVVHPSIDLRRARRSTHRQRAQHRARWCRDASANHGLASSAG